MDPQDLQRRFREGQTFAESVQTAGANQELWRAIYARAAVPVDIAARVGALGGEWHLLILSEDWCGDSINTLPIIARLTEAVPNLDLRILGRDANPDLMDAHRTNGSRSIPVVTVLDSAFRERGWWGPRPAELQAWVMGEGKALPKVERYRAVRGWYARDRGMSTLREVVDLLERAAGAMPTERVGAGAAFSPVTTE